MVAHARHTLPRVAAPLLLLLAACGRSASPTADRVPPDPITDLRVAAVGAGFVELAWTATGDDGSLGRATAYDLRYGPDSLTEARWAGASRWAHSPAPRPAGEVDTVSVAGLDPTRRLYFGLKALDEASNASAVSNVVAALPAAEADSLPPAAVTDLSIGNVRLARVTLHWTAPGDDGRAGRADRYQVRFATAAITEQNWAAATPALTTTLVPRSAGAAESLAVTTLLPGTAWFFALKTIDGSGNSSTLSNGATGRTLEPAAVEAMLPIPAGTFTMGSPPEEPGRYPYETPHAVTLTRAFYLSDHEVTQAEWERTMGWDLSFFAHQSANPVETITWYDALDYCNRLSAREGLRPAYLLTNVRRPAVIHITGATVAWVDSSNGFRLPTEAEWEYACRAGTTTAFHSGAITATACEPLDPNLSRVGCYCGNSYDYQGNPRAQPKNIRGRAHNAFGLYDMHGNVEEWCWDWYGDYPAGPGTDPRGPADGADRVVRGGSWEYFAQHCRSASRTWIPPGFASNVLGLRVARSRP